MSDGRRMHWLNWLLLMIVAGVATLSRAWYLRDCVEMGHAAAPLLVEDAPPSPPTKDNRLPQANDFDHLVSNLTGEVQQFTSYAPLADKQEKTADTAPGYIWLLAAANAWFESPHVIIRWTQCVLGVFTAVFCFMFAWQAFRSTVVAAIAGLLAALHPFWIINTAEINDGVLTTFLMSASLFLGVRASQLGAPVPGLFFGLSLAGMSLVRAMLLPFALLAMMWFLLHSRHVKKGWFCALLAFLGFANGLAPWMVRNFQAFDRPVPIADSAYYHLWIGNNPHATGGPMAEKEMRDLLPQKRLSDLLGEANQSKRYDMLSSEVLEEINTNPAATVARRIWAGLYFVFGKVWFEHSSFAVRNSTLPEWLDSSYEGTLNGVMLGMILLSLLGWRWTWPQHRHTQLLAMALIWVPLPYLLSHAEMLSGPRLPLDVVLLALSAFALACMIPGMASRLSADADRTV